MRIGIILFLFFIFTPTTLAIPVIPGSSGFGMDTPAGRGGTVYKVTNLNANGSGSLRECIDASGPRICVFEVSGTIKLTSSLKIKNPFITIAGQTAPSPGITVRGADIRTRTNDILIQHIRIRTGDSSIGPSPGNRDGICLNEVSNNIVIDHVSVSWAIDENVCAGGGVVNDVTFSNMIISEGLKDSIHPKGKHSMGMLINGDELDRVERIAILRNLFAHNMDRNPLVQFDTTTYIANNLIYNRAHGGTKFGHGAMKASVINNVYISGINTTSNNPIQCNSLCIGEKIYVSGNMEDGNIPNNQWGMGTTNSPPITVSGFTPLSTSQVKDFVLLNAGARPADRDSVDKRVVQSVRDGTGRQIDSQNDVGGWPNLARVYRALTIPSNPNGDSDGDGYTNLEEWLHGYAADVEGGGTISPPPPPPTSNNADLNSDGKVDVTDLGILLSGWGGSGSADINNDGVVDVVDLGILLSGWT